MLRALAALPYHREVADVLERENPASFAALRPQGSGPGAGLDDALLRSTYRLEPESHAGAHAALARAGAALGVSATLELYAHAGDGQPNAELVFTPDRAIVLVSGGLLDLLDDDELCGVLGHELAHHVLWLTDDGRYLAASRLLDAVEQDARTPGEYLETARRFRLATELACDRGALIACDNLNAVVSGLLKVSTGLRTVDPQAYLRQAAEVSFATNRSAGRTHPETVLRAWALQRWHGTDPEAADQVDDVEEQVRSAIGSSHDLSALDLPGQDAILAITRELVREAMFLTALRTPDAVELAGRYGVAAAPGATPLSEIRSENYSRMPVETRRLWCAALLDLATAHEDGDHEALAAALAVANRKCFGADLLKVLAVELSLSDAQRHRISLRADELVRPPGGR